MKRRDSLRHLAALSAVIGDAGAGARLAHGRDAPAPKVSYPAVQAGPALQFPRDHGAHFDFRTEWWYVTGWLDAPGEALGFQITFFRSRTGHDANNPSRLAPTQLLFAHAALADPRRQKLLHDERSARIGLGYASASGERTQLKIGDWTFAQRDNQQYQSVIAGQAFSLSLSLSTPEPPWLQGAGGFSRKGPNPAQASYYYSRPQLAVQATLQRHDLAVGGTSAPAQSLRGLAWLDHEWSSELLDPRASGWDWIGLNFDNGDALMAFRIRTASEAPALWRYANLRRADGGASDYSESLSFIALRWWRSPRTEIRYPVEIAIEVGDRRLRLAPLFDDQELDSRRSTGAIYWEGAVRVFEAERVIGRGYLELTGYGERLRL